VLRAHDERPEDVIDEARGLGGHHAEDAGEEVAENGNYSEPAHQAPMSAMVPHAATLLVRYQTVN
jgi:hypothetical protein